MSDGETEAARGRTWTKWPEDTSTPDLTTLEREVIEAAVTWHRVIGRDHTGECGHELGVACRLCDLAAPIRALRDARKPKGVKPETAAPGTVFKFADDALSKSTYRLLKGPQGPIYISADDSDHETYGEFRDELIIPIANQTQEPEND